MDATPTKQTRTRRVFGRLHWKRKDGIVFVFEMTEFGVMLRRKGSRQEPAILSFRKLHEMTVNQPELLL